MWLALEPGDLGTILGASWELSNKCCTKKEIISTVRVCWLRKALES